MVIEVINNLQPVEYAEKNGKKIHKRVIKTEKKYPVVVVLVKKLL